MSKVSGPSGGCAKIAVDSPVLDSIAAVSPAGLGPTLLVFALHLPPQRLPESGSHASTQLTRPQPLAQGQSCPDVSFEVSLQRSCLTQCVSRAGTASVC